MTTSKFLRNEEGCNNGHGTHSNAYHCTFHSSKHLCTNATDEKHDQYRLICTLLRSVLQKFTLLEGPEGIHPLLNIPFANIEKERPSP